MERVGGRQDTEHHGLLRPRGHPAPVRTGRPLHPLRLLLLLGVRLDQPQPQLPVDRHHRPRAGRGRAGRHQRRLRPRPRRLHLDDLPRTTGDRRRVLADLPGVGQLHRQRGGVLPAVEGDRPQNPRACHRPVRHHRAVLRQPAAQVSRAAHDRTGRVPEGRRRADRRRTAALPARRPPLRARLPGPPDPVRHRRRDPAAGQLDRPDGGTVRTSRQFHPGRQRPPGPRPPRRRRQ